MGEEEWGRGDGGVVGEIGVDCFMTTIELQVVAIRPEATEMVTINLRRVDGLPLDYRAGQFLTFLFSFGGRELRRSYSFSSTPGVDALPSITVKRVANGEISRLLIGRLKVGDVLQSLPPSGKFLLEERGGQVALGGRRQDCAWC
jgi:ring-1,2-phenylacetyl-CoA epoxidase subunit PaaE